MASERSVKAVQNTSNRRRSSYLPTKPLPDLGNLLKSDDNLTDYAEHICDRYHRYAEKKRQIIEAEQSLKQFSEGYKTFGIHINPDNSVTCREWAPGAFKLYLTGDFNNWDRLSHPYKRVDLRHGKWELNLPANNDGSCPIKHLSQVQILVMDRNEKLFERISPWATYVEKPLKYRGTVYQHLIWNPPKQYAFKHPRPRKPPNLKIYECHVGIATHEEKVGTYNEFRRNLLPRIVKLGYNAIQLMGIMEHAYYASFGYQVTSFFAVSSRFGTPNELKLLIDTAHKHGLVVLLDIVHSHASANEEDGLSNFDCTDACHFHSGPRGWHSAWGSRVFDYGQWEVLRFLLSNLRWYVDEYQFDGFRFDAVSSMLYKTHHFEELIDGEPPEGVYDCYFGPNLDMDSSVYLMLANDLLHSLNPDVVTIAEEVSGMPTICRPIREGGFGFDYRLGMAIPDLWVKLLKRYRDEDWDIGHIVWTLTNRRQKEKTIAYCESHDQALVGDKTIAFWLMDKEMYTHMSAICSPDSIVIDRGLALHKMIRLLSQSLGGEGYLNFMGNEFGHPEWLDFPHKYNGESYRYARRQWNLVDDPNLKYRMLNEFDVEMNRLENKFKWLAAAPARVTVQDEQKKVIAFSRGSLVFAFNFHPNVSFPNCRVGAPVPGPYTMILDSDEKRFGGHARLDSSVLVEADDIQCGGFDQSLVLYIPCRTAVIWAPKATPILSRIPTVTV